MFAREEFSRELLWSTPLDVITEIPIMVADGLVYIESWTDTGGGTRGNQLSVLDASTGELAWEYELDSTLPFAPVVAGGVAYIMAAGTLHAVDPSTGQMLWRFETGRAEAAPEVVDGVVYVSAEGSVYALLASGQPGTAPSRADTTQPALAPGELLWRIETDGRWNSPPVVAAGTVYFGSTDQHVYAVDSETGAVRWRYDAEADVYSRPTVVGENVFIGGRANIGAGSYQSYVQALDSATGEPGRSYGDGRNQDRVTPVVGDAFVFFDVGGSMFSVEASTGRPLWRADVAQRDSRPAFAEGMVFVRTSGAVRGLDPASGGTRWMFDVKEEYDIPTIVYTRPEATRGALFFETRAQFAQQEVQLEALYAATGRRIWQKNIGEGGVTSPAVANGILCYGLAGDGLHAWHMVSGKSLWQADLDIGPGDPLKVVRQVLYVGTTSGVSRGTFHSHVHALDSSTGDVIWQYELDGRLAGDTIESAGGVVYVGAGDGVYALDAATGQLVRHYRVGCAVSATPEVIDGVIYVSCQGSLLALDATP